MKFTFQKSLEVMDKRTEEKTLAVKNAFITPDGLFAYHNSPEPLSSLQSPTYQQAPSLLHFTVNGKLDGYASYYQLPTLKSLGTQPPAGILSKQ
jgi:hypothetical protein